MHLTDEDVVRLAYQARFVLTPEEIARFRTQLNSVLQEMAILDELDGDATTLSPADDAVRMRADDSQPDRLEHSLETLSADLVADFFTVPRVIGGGVRTP